MILSTLVLAACVAPLPPPTYAEGAATARQTGMVLVTYVGCPLPGPSPAAVMPSYVTAHADALPPFPRGSVVVSVWTADGRHVGFVKGANEAVEQTILRLRAATAVEQNRPQQLAIPGYPYPSCPGGNCPRPTWR